MKPSYKKIRDILIYAGVFSSVSVMLGIFSRILKYGKATLTEPNKYILVTEVILSILLLIGVSFQFKELIWGKD